MLVKIIFLFLLAMVLIALIGRAFFPSALPRLMRKRAGAPRCTECGRPLIGQKACDCGGKTK
jgi:hypothetical protein